MWFDEAPKEMLEVVEQKYGKFFASAMFALGTAAFICLTLGIIASSLYALNEWVIAPVLRSLPSMNVTGLRSPLVSFAISTLLLVGTASFAYRHFKSFEGAVHRNMVEVVPKAIVEYVKTNAKDLAGIPEIKEQIESLSKRIKVFEDDRVKKEFLELLVQREMGQRLTIHSAQYGSTGRGVDVTKRVRTHIKNGKEVNIRVDDDTLGGDPTDRDKALDVKYSIGDDAPEHIRVREHEYLSIPVPRRP